MSELFKSNREAGKRPAKGAPLPDLYVITPRDLLESNVHASVGWRIGAIVDYLEDTGIDFAGEEEFELLRPRPDDVLKKQFIDGRAYTRLLFPAAEEGNRIPTLKLLRTKGSKVLMPGTPLYREYSWNVDGRLLVRGKRPEKQRKG